MPSTPSTSSPAAGLLQLLQAHFAVSNTLLPCGATVAVRQCGRRSAAPSIVLLHGISSGAASWLHSALLLAQQHHVLAWDAPGYGSSTPLVQASPTAQDYAARLGDMLQTLDISSCVLVGHSLGALIAAAYAANTVSAANAVSAATAQSAVTVRRLVLISPAGGYGAAGMEGMANKQAQVRTERRSALHKLGVAGLAAQLPQRLLSSTASAADRAWVQWNAERMHAAGYLQAVELLCNADLGRYTGLAMPVEVHCGDADVVTPPAQSAAWAAKLAAPYRAILQAGHASPVEQPAAVAQLIAAAHKASV